MHRRLLVSALSATLAMAFCCHLYVHAQSGRAQHLRPTAAARGLSGREIKTRAEVKPEQPDETKDAEGVNPTGNPKFDPRSLNERGATVVHSLDPEYITFAVIMGMIVLILLSRRV